MRTIKSKNREPTNKQLNFMYALLSEPTIKSAYESVGIAEVTAYRWLKDENFNKNYKKLRREFIKNTTARLQANSILAVDTLASIARDETASSLARVQSARTILEFAYRGTEIEDIEERIAHLEELTANQEGHNNDNNTIDIF